MQNMSKNIYTDEYKFVVEQLKKARKASGLTQVDVANKLERPQSYVSKCESGERRLDITELKKLANLYKKKIDFFIKN